MDPKLLINTTCLINNARLCAFGHSHILLVESTIRLLNYSNCFPLSSNSSQYFNYSLSSAQNIPFFIEKCGQEECGSSYRKRYIVR